MSGSLVLEDSDSEWGCGFIPVTLSCSSLEGLGMDMVDSSDACNPGNRTLDHISHRCNMDAFVSTDFPDPLGLLEAQEDPFEPFAALDHDGWWCGGKTL